jgi:hypothetical protein
VHIQAPSHSGSDYFNYQQYNSIVLLALANHDYCFTYVDVGSKGRASDAEIFKNSSLFHNIEAGHTKLPDGGVFVADEAFPLTTYIMKPHAGRQLNLERKVFNYRLSRARRITENTFGIVCSRFRIFSKPMTLKPDTVQLIVLTTVSEKEVQLIYPVVSLTQKM